MVSLDRAVAVAYVHRATAGLAEVDRVASDPRLERDHRLLAVRAHLLEMCGDDAAARRSYERAAELSTSLPRQRSLHGRARSLAGS